MPTIINHNRPKNGDITSPTAAELWVLTQVRETLALRFEVREVWEDQAWAHHEDEELGFPPLGTMVGFSIALPQLWLQLETQYWHAPGDDTLSLHLYNLNLSAPGGSFRSPNAKTALLLSSLGLKESGGAWYALFKVRSAQDHAVVAEIVRLVEGLAAIPFPVTD